MASPLLSSFCCETQCDDVFANGTCVSSNFSWEAHIGDVVLSYNILCIVTSVIGVIGAVYQLKLRLEIHHGTSHPVPRVIECQSNIIFWLAAADGLASLGIFIRSWTWIAKFTNRLFCAVLSGWIQYFYICTYFWTFMFAVDTFLNATNKNKCSVWMYHLLSWVVSLLLCLGGLISLYYPGLKSCGNSSYMKRLPHYLTAYVPMLCVMIINPILFFHSSQRVKKDLCQRGSSVNERKQIVGEVLNKFCSVVLIFYVCWLPNVINGILLLSSGLSVKDHGKWFYSVSIALWQIMALLNPIQGFLNSLVYSSIALWPHDQLIHYRRQSNVPAPATEAENTASVPAEEDDEDTSSEGDPAWTQDRSETSPILLFR